MAQDMWKALQDWCTTQLGSRWEYGGSTDKLTSIAKITNTGTKIYKPCGRKYKTTTGPTQNLAVHKLHHGRSQVAPSKYGGPNILEYFLLFLYFQMVITFEPR